MKRSEIRAALIEQGAEGWRGSRPALDGTLTVQMARYGMKLAIEGAHSKEQFAALKAYYDSLSERGRNVIAGQIVKKVLTFR